MRRPAIDDTEPQKKSFDPAILDRIIQETVAPAAEEIDRTGAFPREALHALGKEGLLGLVSSAEVGGQRGKDRAEFVLRHVRNTLPSSLQNKVRASISKMLDSIPSEKLWQVKVPSEIVTLIDELVTRATA